MSFPPSDLRDYLSQFYVMTDEEYNLFSSFFSVVTIPPRQKLICEGQSEEYIYYVVKGIFRKYFQRGSIEIVTGFYKEKDICHSAVSYYTGHPSGISIEALEESVCVRILRKDIEYLFGEIPGLEKIFRGVLATLYVKKDIDQMNTLRYSKKERFLMFCEEYPDLLQRVPQKYLASFLEMAPETFCRLKHVRYEIARKKYSSKISQ